ncbi:MAG: hypothetical protein RLZZ223_344 [Candidatus Parcubacteria bacterium]|jgi:hypothetical protein
MFLSLTLFLGILLHIWAPSPFMPILFLGPLAIYVLARKYWVIIIWITTITLMLSISSLTPWFISLLLYVVWCFSFYIISLFIERSWPVQSIFAVICLLVANLIVYGVSIDYILLVIYIIINSIFITLFLYLAEKYNFYERYV